MIPEKPDIDKIASELKFTTSRSGGPGGQGVNKLNTKVTLRWHVANSSAIDDNQRQVIVDKLKSVLNQVGEVVLAADSSRSQLQNKEEAINKLDALLAKAFAIIKPRKRTKPTKASVKRRLDDKRRLANKKKQRKDLE